MFYMYLKEKRKPLNLALKFSTNAYMSISESSSPSPSSYITPEVVGVFIGWGGASNSYGSAVTQHQVPIKRRCDLCERTFLRHHKPVNLVFNKNVISKSEKYFLQSKDGNRRVNTSCIYTFIHTSYWHGQPIVGNKFLN